MVRQIVFLGVDETERREAEHALFAAERLTTVGEMAATVAHELSQPLQVIDLACHTASDVLSEATKRGSAVDPDFMATKLDRITLQVERASRIVGDLRAFVRGASAGDDPRTVPDRRRREGGGRSHGPWPAPAADDAVGVAA